jgi:SH3-like domain-containing protein
MRHENALSDWNFSSYSDKITPSGASLKSLRVKTTRARQDQLMKSLIVSVVLVAAMMMPMAAFAERGPVTNLPMPRFVSLKAVEGNVRRGPSLSHRIDWVFKHRNMPLQVIAEHGHWRRVVDRDGAGGWVHYTLLSGARTVLIEEDMAAVHRMADPASDVAAFLEVGVIARLGKCKDGWCRVTADGNKGWMRKEQFWGLMPGEARN